MLFNTSIACLVVIRETEYVYCAVRAEYLNKIKVFLVLKILIFLPSLILCRIIWRININF